MSDDVKFSTKLPRAEYELLVREAREAARSVSGEAAVRLRLSFNGALAGRDQAREADANGGLTASTPARGDDSVKPAHVSSPPLAPRPASASEPQEPGRSLPASPPQSPGAVTSAEVYVGASPRPAGTEPGSDALAAVLARPDVTTGSRVQAKPFSKTDQAGRKK